ncbi:hypothetical protein [uncultured Bacteroides sp.]|uniref:hypothetical protein n=1 Tax=uncultured Bacteroides sp. TaxID=162156 RepID=UPI002AAB9665|nr:hypothetical protein [uncultured Bacteroides sp.]
MRIIEQHQILEQDKRGNPWLSLSVWDLSPDQTSFQGVRSHLLDCRTGKYHSLQELAEEISTNPLSSREVEVLNLIKEGVA